MASVLEHCRIDDPTNVVMVDIGMVKRPWWSTNENNIDGSCSIINIYIINIYSVFVYRV